MVQTKIHVEVPGVYESQVNRTVDVLRILGGDPSLRKES